MKLAGDHKGVIRKLSDFNQSAIWGNAREYHPMLFEFLPE
jgi:hypothetical protein